MRRLAKTSALVVIAYFLMVSGINVALDRLEQSRQQSQFTLYNARGTVLLTYQGDLRQCPEVLHPSTLGQQSPGLPSGLAARP